MGGNQFDFVTKALSYDECDTIHNVCAVGSSYPPFLDRVLEHDGGGKDLSIGNAIRYDDCNEKVRYFNFQFPIDCLLRLFSFGYFYLHSVITEGRRIWRASRGRKYATRTGSRRGRRMRLLGD